MKPPPDPATTPVIVGLSGGKDSAATVLALRDRGIEPWGAVYADTGWEHTEHYAYLDYLAAVLGIELHRVRADIDVPETPAELSPVLAARLGMPRETTRRAVAERLEEILGISPSPMVRRICKYMSLPAAHRRWCTEQLKADPINEWWDEYAPDGAVYATGIRRAESARRSSYSEWERQPDGERWHWRPIIDWSVEQVMHRLTAAGIRPQPTYTMGAPRVGCWPCVRYSKASLRALGQDEARVGFVSLLESVVQELGGHDGCWGLAKKPGADGRHAPIPVIDLVAWAQTERGGEQIMLIPPRSDCERWGWCDVGEDPT